MKHGVMLLFMFVILGCGYQSTPSEGDEPSLSSNSKKILPEKISVNFPTTLKDSISTTSQTDSSEFEEKKESNLEQLKKDIYKAEDVVQIAKINLILLEQVIPKILEDCSGVESCVFPANELSFSLNQKIISDIDSVFETKERDFLNTNNILVSLGQIEFLKYENQKYEYELNLDMLNSSFTNRDDTVKEEKQIFKWSTKTDKVIITYLYEDNNSNSLNTTIRYFITNEGEELMYLSDKNDTNVSIENTTLVLKNSDQNSSYSLTSNTTIQQLSANETNSSYFSTNIEVDNSGAKLLLLDKNSTLNVLDESQTDASLDIEVVPTQPIALSVSGSRIENLPPPQEDNNKLTLFVFEVDAEGLPSGDYLLLKPNTNTAELSLEELLNSAIGSFSVTEGKPQGALYSDEFLDLLDELIIVKIIDSQESTEISEFIVIENKPTLNIVKK